MNIIHNPITDIQAVIDSFANKGETVQYVCTTELPKFDNTPIDIFYRTDGVPHPDFGNVYFGLFFNGDSMVICNADDIKSLTFALLPTPDGYIYSRYRHDYVSSNAGFIDGGRSYTRTNGNVVSAHIVNGELIPF